MSEDTNKSRSQEGEKSRKATWESASSRRSQRGNKRTRQYEDTRRGYRDSQHDDAKGASRNNRGTGTKRRWEDREDYRSGSRKNRRQKWEDKPRDTYRGDRREDKRSGRRGEYKDDKRGYRRDKRDDYRDDYRDNRRYGRGRDERDSERRSYRDDRRSYGNDRRGYRNDRQNWRDDRRDERQNRYRDDSAQRPRDPQIPEFVSASDLDGDARAHLRSLSKNNAERVARHLVYAGSMMDENPELAYEHAHAAYRHAARIDIVREALGLTSYLTGRYSQALRELRTYRRMTDDYSHVAIEADAERGLGRAEKALRFIDEIPLKKLDAESRIELALVKSGARADTGDSAGGLEVIERIKVDKLDKILRARIELIRADRYEELGREKEAGELREKWAPIFDENGEIDFYEEDES